MKAFAYARYSSTNQREESIEAQIRYIDEYAIDNDIKIIEYYYDRAKSAATKLENRTGLLTLLRDIKNDDEVNIILIHKYDRFSRNVNEQGMLMLKLQELDVRLIAVDENLDLDDPNQELLFNIKGSINHLYSRNLGKEAMKGLKENAFKGTHCGGIPPLGYDLDKDTKKLIINKKEVEIIKLIFKMFLDGASYSFISETLNNLGYKTKTNGKFTFNSFSSILKNEKYTGTFIWNVRSAKNRQGKRNNNQKKSDEEIIKIENHHPPIISKEDYEFAQEKMQRRKNTKPGLHKEKYLLVGKIFCDCGEHMNGVRNHSGQNKRLWVGYFCSGRKKYKNCKSKPINKIYIEGFILKYLSDFIFSFESDSSWMEEYKEFILSQELNSTSHTVEIKKYIIQTQNEINSVIEILISLKSDSLKVKLLELENRKKSLEKEYDNSIKAEKKRELKEKEIKQLIKSTKELFIEGKLENEKQIIDSLVKKVIVNNDNIDVIINIASSVLDNELDMVLSSQYEHKISISREELINYGQSLKNRVN